MNKIWDSCILGPGEDKSYNCKTISSLIFSIFGCLNKCDSEAVKTLSHLPSDSSFSSCSYAIDGDSQSILFPLDPTGNKGARPFAGKALCRSVTYFFNSSLSMMAALWLSWLSLPMQKSCPNLEERGCSMQRQTLDSNIFENEAVLGPVHRHIYHHSSPF